METPKTFKYWLKRFDAFIRFFSCILTEICCKISMKTLYWRFQGAVLFTFSSWNTHVHYYTVLQQLALLASWSCKPALLYLPSSLVLCYWRCPTLTQCWWTGWALFAPYLCIHSAVDLLKNRGWSYTLASELSRPGRLIHASVLQMQMHKTNIIVVRVRLMISHPDVVDRLVWLTGSTSFLCRCSQRTAAGWASRAILQQYTMSGQSFFQWSPSVLLRTMLLFGCSNRSL